MSLAGVIGTVTLAMSALDLLVPFFEEEPEIAGEQLSLSEIKGRIDVSHVSLRYSGDASYVLDDLNLVY